MRSLLLFGPLALVGFGAGILYGLSRRPGATPRRRRALSILWILTLLVGGPLWLFLAAALGV